MNDAAVIIIAAVVLMPAAAVAFVLAWRGGTREAARQHALDIARPTMGQEES